MLYRDDGKGASSNNTGFFAHFRQGVLDNGDFNIDVPSNNQSVAIESSNINNTDVWLYTLDTDTGLEDTLWTKVDSVTGNNVIYNYRKNIRNIYNVKWADDSISLKFADGIFVIYLR